MIRRHLEASKKVNLIAIGSRDIAAHLGVDESIALVEKAMRALSGGETRQLLRRIMPVPGGPGMVGDMLGSLGASSAFGLKCVSVFPGELTGRPSHRGAVLLFEPSIGEPVALIEAGLLTAVRTAAASAFATRLLARDDARTLGILGAGEQAARHIPALLRVRPFEQVRIWSRNPQRARGLIGEIALPAGVALDVVGSPREAAAADVICTLTSASEPVLEGAWVRPGTHVNLVGSSHAGACEADEALVASARYFVDSEESARAQAAEFLRARAAGAVSDGHMLGEIGAVANGALPGRLSDRDITVYKSLGSIVQDLACGWYLYEQSRRLGFGTPIEL
jgi:ornithine cyclodeaminase